MRKKNRINRAIKYSAVAFFAIVIIFIILSSGVTVVHAATSAKSEYEASNVMDDLQGSTIGGNAFDLKDYPLSEDGAPQLISFIEFCYSPYINKQDDFGLYVYVYNPCQTAFDAVTERNKIQFGYGDKSTEKYVLEFLNYSDKSGLEGRFYKFRVRLSQSQREDMLKSLNEKSRVYKIAEIELSVKGNVTAYTCGQKYTYTGYAKGYGSELSEGNTLSCTVDGFDRCVNLDVKHTEYRPKGDYYNGEQSQLNSVYFRVPERYFESFGDLTEIACEWYEYFTKPLLVSNDKKTVNAINSLYGRKTMELPTDDYYLFEVYWQNISDGYFEKAFKGSWTSNRDYYGDWYKFGFLWLDSVEFTDPDFGGFAGAFYSDKLDRGSVDDAVSGNDVLKLLSEHSKKLGGNMIQGRYSEGLFENFVQNGYTRGYNKKTISKDAQMEIFWNTLKVKTAFQKMFSSSINVTTEYDFLNAVQVIEDKDLSGTNSEISDKLRINAKDVVSFKAENEKAKLNKERLVLFRYSTTKYLCAPATSANCKGSEINSGTSDGEILANVCHKLAKDSKWNCFVAQETVYLDFDIISLLFNADGVKTEIPSVLSPVDITGELTPPLEEPETPSSDVGQWFEKLWDKITGIKWWVWLLIGVGIIVAISLIVSFIKFGIEAIILGIWWLIKSLILGIWTIISFPFRLIAKLFSDGGDK